MFVFPFLSSPLFSTTPIFYFCLRILFNSFFRASLWHMPERVIVWLEKVFFRVLFLILFFFSLFLSTHHQSVLPAEKKKSTILYGEIFPITLNRIRNESKNGVADRGTVFGCCWNIPKREATAMNVLNDFSRPNRKPLVIFWTKRWKGVKK